MSFDWKLNKHVFYSKLKSLDLTMMYRICIFLFNLCVCVYDAHIYIYLFHVVFCGDGISE